MIRLLRHLIGWFIGFFRSRQDLILENLALREQLLALSAKRPLGSVRSEVKNSGHWVCPPCDPGGPEFLTTLGC